MVVVLVVQNSIVEAQTLAKEELAVELKSLLAEQKVDLTNATFLGMGTVNQNGYEASFQQAVVADGKLYGGTMLKK